MSSKLPWYQEGLRFECTGCGKCCTGDPGYVWVSPEEVESMSSHLSISLEEFSRLYVRRVGERFSLIEVTPSNDCIFLKDNKCSVYSVRPKQCQTFPFWVQNLKSKEDWAKAAKHCEGISEKAPLVPEDTIRKISREAPI